MKRKLALGLSGIMAVSALTGCGGSKSSYLLNVNYSDYVTLCEYKGVEATKVNFDVSDQEIQESIQDGMYDYVSYDVVTERGVEEGDYVNIDYTTTIDGEESEDYSSADEDIMIGEEYIYPEVEDALIGMKTGESKTVELILTEDYVEEEDAGKNATVEVIVNEISVENIPEYNEEFVKENMDYDSMEAYEASVKEELMASKEEEYKYATVEEIFDFILNNSQFNGYPEELYKQCEENYDDTNAYYASMYGMELGDYMELFGIDDAAREQDIIDSVNLELIIGAIAQKEKISCTKEDVKKFAKDVYEDYYYESVDEFLEDYSEEAIGSELIYEKVTDLLYENAKYVEISEKEYLEEQENDWYEDDFEVEDDEEEGVAFETEEGEQEDGSMQGEDTEEDASEADEVGEEAVSEADEAGEEDGSMPDEAGE